MRSLKGRIRKLESVWRPRFERLAVIGLRSRSDPSMAELAKCTKVEAVQFVRAREGRPIKEAEDACH